jgi:hypothetical protein
MRDLGPYIYLLLFAAFALLNYVMQRLAKRRNEQSAADEEARPEPEDERRRAEELTRRRAEELAQRAQESTRRRAEELAQRAQEPTRRRAGEPARRLEPSTKPGGPMLPVRPAAERISRVRAVTEEPEEVRKARARSARAAEIQIGARAQGAGRPDLRALLADRRNLRQAIVLMTVLGPCRAQQPRDML